MGSTRSRQGAGAVTSASAAAPPSRIPRLLGHGLLTRQGSPLAPASPPPATIFQARHGRRKRWQELRTNGAPCSDCRTAIASSGRANRAMPPLRPGQAARARCESSSSRKPRSRSAWYRAAVGNLGLGDHGAAAGANTAGRRIRDPATPPFDRSGARTVTSTAFAPATIRCQPESRIGCSRRAAPPPWRGRR